MGLRAQRPPPPTSSQVREPSAVYPTHQPQGRRRRGSTHESARRVAVPSVCIPVTRTRLAVNTMPLQRGYGKIHKNAGSGGGKRVFGEEGGGVEPPYLGTGLPSREPPRWQGCPLEPIFVFVKDSPQGPSTATTNRHHQPPAATNHSVPNATNCQPPTANRQPPPTVNRQPPPTPDPQPPTPNRRQPPTIVQYCFCSFLSCPCLDHEAESVPVKVRFCWCVERPPFFPLKNSPAGWGALEKGLE